MIANHDDLRSMVEWHGIPYFHVPVDPQDKQPAFDEVSRLIDEHGADCIVLARYMQILPPDLCRKYAHQVINIHHSFLPSFIGAKPYHQASKARGQADRRDQPLRDRGTGCRSDHRAGRGAGHHRDNVEDMVRLGKDVEKLVLARGLRYHLEDRVLVHGNKTVVFD